MLRYTIEAFGSFRPLSRSSHQMKRSVSFTSLLLAKGSFPAKKKVVEPIMNAAIYVKKVPSVEDVVELVVKPLLKHERFSKSLDTANGELQDIQYDVPDLVQRIEVRGDESATMEAIEAAMQKPLVRADLPWWEVVVIDNRRKGRSVILLRVHHTLGDGIGLILASAGILKQTDGTAVKLPDGGKPNGRPRRSFLQSLRLVWDLVIATFHALFLGMSRYDNTNFSQASKKLEHSESRKITVFPDVDLGFVKAIKSAAGVTVNDVLLTAVSYAISKLNNNTDSGKRRCRALMPVGFPRTEDVMRNKWCMVSCDMHVTEPDILDRLLAIRSTTNALKTKPYAPVQLALQNTIPPKLPFKIAQQMAYDVFSRHSLVFSNVAGMQEPCVIAGVEITGLQSFFNNLLTQVCFVSYAGNVSGNIMYDDTALDLSEFGDWYLSALIQMAERLNVPVPPE